MKELSLERFSVLEECSLDSKFRRRIRASSCAGECALDRLCELAEFLKFAVILVRVRSRLSVDRSRRDAI